MDRNFRPSRVWLAPEELLRLDGARGKTIAVESGHVWITQAGNPEDTVLGPGECLRFARGGMALVQAFERTELRVCDAGNLGGRAGNQPTWANFAVGRDFASAATIRAIHADDAVRRDAFYRGLSFLSR